MKNLKTIIVGLDFSQYSKLVLKEAHYLAQKLRCKVIYVHVYSNPMPYEWQRQLLSPQIKQYFEGQLKEFYSLKSDANIILKSGSAYKQIIAAAKKVPHSLILVGHRGEQNLVEHFFIGSTAERVALYSKRPVFIYRGEKNTLPQKVLIPCDFTHRDKKALTGLKKLGLNDSGIEFFHAIQPPPPVLDYQFYQALSDSLNLQHRKNLIRFKKMFAKYKLSEQKTADTVGAILKHSRKFDLIAISPRDHSGLFSGFGSVTSKLVRSGDTSILVLP